MRQYGMRITLVVILVLSSVAPAFGECMACVLGLDDVWVCKDSHVYTNPQWIEFDPCSVETRCWRMPGAGQECHTTCRFGNMCYMA